MNKKLGQGSAFPSWDMTFEENPKTHLFSAGTEHGMSKRFYAACAAKDDFDEFSRRLHEKLIGRPAPDVETNPVDFLKWYAEGRAKWRYMQADELLKQENE